MDIITLKHNIIKLLEDNKYIKLSKIDYRKLENKTRYSTLLKLYEKIDYIIKNIHKEINYKFNNNNVDNKINEDVDKKFNDINNILKINEENNNKLLDMINNLKNELNEKNKDIFIMKQKENDNNYKINEYKKIIKSLNKTIEDYKNDDKNKNNNNHDDNNNNNDDNDENNKINKNYNYYEIPKLTDNKINKLLINYGCKYENVKILNKHEKKVLLNKFRGLNKLQRIYK